MSQTFASAPEAAAAWWAEQIGAPRYKMVGDKEPPEDHEGGCGQYIADPERCGVCGGTFAQHYGKSNEDWTHSYTSAVAS